MKTELKKYSAQRERLLGDVFAEDFKEPEHGDMNLLLREFRRAYWRRKASAVLLAAAAVFAVGILSALYLRDARQETSFAASTVASPGPEQSVSASAPKTGESSDYLSDEELLNLFPANSCFLAEFDDKQVLVFKDPALAAAVLK
jgi:hypothetical protein